MKVISLKVTEEELAYLDALLTNGHGISRSQILRDGMIDYGERYLDVSREREKASDVTTWRRQRKRTKQPKMSEVRAALRQLTAPPVEVRPIPLCEVFADFADNSEESGNVDAGSV